VAGRRHTRSELKDAPPEIGDPMIDNLDPAEYDAFLRQDFETFAARCFHDLNPQTCKRRSKNPSLKRPVGPVAPE
jgi:hypothetical protein